MELFIDDRNGTPIYQQLQQQLERQILSGQLAADAPLPSIRGLAKDLRISVITTKRVYEELEREGLIYTVPGKGSFVSHQSASALRERHQKEIEAHLRTAVRLGKDCKLDTGALKELLDRIMEEEL